MYEANFSKIREYERNAHFSALKLQIRTIMNWGWCKNLFKPLSTRIIRDGWIHRQFWFP